MRTDAEVQLDVACQSLPQEPALFCSRSSCQHATSATIVQRYRITMLFKYSFSRAHHKLHQAATRQTQYLRIIRKQLACVVGHDFWLPTELSRRCVLWPLSSFRRDAYAPLLLVGHETTIVAKNVGCLIVVHVKALKKRLSLRERGTLDNEIWLRKMT